MKNQKALFILLCATVLMVFMSCKSTPPAQPPDQESLDTMNAAMARAESAREQASAVNGQAYFPDRWQQAESNYQAARGTNKETMDGVTEAITLFNQAADEWEAIAEESGPLYAKDVEEAKLALAAATTRAGQSRQGAMDSQGQSYFPDDWEAAESRYQSGENAPKDSLNEMRAAAGMYTAAADAFDDIAERSRPLLAAEREEAMAALQQAIARADQSRKNAQDAQAATHFPNEWRGAEAQMQAGRSARTATPDEIRAAQELFAAAADAYDDLAERSRPMAAAASAQQALTAAIARAERSRQSAVDVDGQTYFPNEWRTAETRNQSARNARRGTPEEMTAATALYVAAADAYDDIANRSRPRFTQDTAAAQRSLQEAINRAQQSRRAAEAARAQTYFPNEWRAAETRNQTATNARRGTIAEMRAAIPLYNAAADAYDDITRRSVARAAEENDTAARAAKERADRERQAAIDARAPVAMPTEYNQAEAIYQQGVTAFNGRTWPTAVERFNQAAPLFTAAARGSETKRGQAETAVIRARERAAESVALATSVGQALDGITDEEGDNESN